MKHKHTETVVVPTEMELIMGNSPKDKNPGLNKRDTLATLEWCRRLAKGLPSAGAEKDPERAHALADKALCDFLRQKGYADVADAFESINPKWYA